MRIVFNSTSPKWFNKYLIANHTDSIHLLLQKNKIDPFDNMTVRKIAIEYFATKNITVTLNKENNLVFELDDKDFLLTILKYSDPE